MSIGTPLLWSLFAAVVVIALIVDFFALNRQGAHRVSTREAAIWSLIWVAVSLAFAGVLWWSQGGLAVDALTRSAANTVLLEFLTGYLIEKALAVDNIFVFLLIFRYFAVPAAYQHRVLCSGASSARWSCAPASSSRARALLERVPLGDVRLRRLPRLHRRQAVLAAGKEPDPETQSRSCGSSAGFVPVTPSYDGQTLLRPRGRRPHRHAALRSCSLLVEHHRPRLRRRLDPRHLRRHHRPVHRLHVEHLRHPRPAGACTSCWPAMHDRFHLLKLGLAVVLVFVGAKMLLIDVYKIPIGYSLVGTVAILATAMVLSLLIPARGPAGTAYPFNAKQDDDPGED